MTHLHADIYSQLCLFVQLGPRPPSFQLDPKHKSNIVMDLFLYSQILVV